MSCRSTKFRNSSTAHTRGFSLIEVVITSAIILIMVSLVIFNYDVFNSTTLLRNQAFEVALDVRSTQLRALNARGSSGSSPDQFRTPFGVHFHKNTYPDRYVIFEDLDGNGWYDDGVEPIVDTVQLDSRFFIQDICYETTAATACSANVANFTYRRPNFDAFFRPDDYPNGSGNMVISMTIKIGLVSDPTVTKDVIITNAGLVYTN